MGKYPTPHEILSSRPYALRFVISIGLYLLSYKTKKGSFNNPALIGIQKILYYLQKDTGS